jgi:hypothetical protein
MSQPKRMGMRAKKQFTPIIGIFSRSTLIKSASAGCPGILSFPNLQIYTNYYTLENLFSRDMYYHGHSIRAIMKKIY